jgi:hypothetical protein
MAKNRKVGVSARAVVARINRKPKPDLEALKISRSERMRLDVGRYFIIDYRLNAIQRHNVDPKALGRELGVLKEWEEVRYE